MGSAAAERPLSYGEKAVGLTFNPGNNPLVQGIKEQYASIIDSVNNLRAEELSKPREEQNGEKIRLFSIAITEAQAAQMWAVKAITWQY
jgi:hypothetical protein